jgi:hypothetical protein
MEGEVSLKQDRFEECAAACDELESDWSDQGTVAHLVWRDWGKHLKPQDIRPSGQDLLRG